MTRYEMHILNNLRHRVREFNVLDRRPMAERSLINDLWREVLRCRNQIDAARRSLSDPGPEREGGL